MFNLFFSGGDCAEDIQTHLRTDPEQIPGNRVPSADTLLREIKELAVANTTVESSQGAKYNFNINEKLNELNIKSSLLTHQLKTCASYDFGWGHLPCSDMYANSVYLIMMAMVKIFYNYITHVTSHCVFNIEVI
jgi:hypothetical protein